MNNFPTYTKDELWKTILEQLQRDPKTLTLVGNRRHNKWIKEMVEEIRLRLKEI